MAQHTNPTRFFVFMDDIKLYLDSLGDRFANELERGIEYGLIKGEDEFWAILSIAKAKKVVKLALNKAGKQYQDILGVEVTKDVDKSLNIQFTFKE